MPRRDPRGPRVLFGPAVILEEPGPLVEPLHRLIIRDDLLAQLLMTLLTKGDLEGDKPALLDERPHHHVAEPQVVTRDGRAGLLYTSCVDQLAATGAVLPAEAGKKGRDRLIRPPIPLPVPPVPGAREGQHNKDDHQDWPGCAP